MPELPEVETVRRGLIPALEGRLIAGAELRRRDFRRPAPADLAERLAGTRVLALRRRAKYLLFDLSSGEVLLIHLGMSGRILVGGAGLAPLHHNQGAAARHDHFVMTGSDGVTVTLNDARRFGCLDLFPTSAEAGHPLLAGLGPEPLAPDFGPEDLAEGFRGRKTPVKAALLDQRVIAGLGNIYVAEALWRAGIAPETPAGAIGGAGLAALARAIPSVLFDAIAAGGSSLRDHRQANGELGYFQHDFAVYDREGQGCRRAGCGGRVQRIVQAGRSTYWCPACQKGDVSAIGEQGEG
jgi:formamidopyrimidine-DNA glycosylase